MSNLRPSDVNPVLQSVIEAARLLYKPLLPGGECNVSCSRSLLDRLDPSPQPQPPYERLCSWAAAAGMLVAAAGDTVRVTIRRK